MKHHKRKKASIYSPIFRVIKGSKSEAKATEEFVSIAWNFAQTALWNNSIFSETEIETSKTIIREYLTMATDQDKAYSAFVQRILLVKQYINNNPNKFVPLPSLWLDRNNANGFAGTRQWFEKMQSVRASLPTYKSELEAFANAIDDMYDSDSATTFHHWRNYFIEKKTPGLLNLFLNTIANQQFSL
jgi:hypothetical protein